MGEELPSGLIGAEMENATKEAGLAANRRIDW